MEKGVWKGIKFCIGEPVGIEPMAEQNYLWAYET